MFRLNYQKFTEGLRFHLTNPTVDCSHKPRVELERFIDRFSQASGVPSCLAGILSVQGKSTDPDLEKAVNLLLDELEQLAPWQLALLQELPAVKKKIEEISKMQTIHPHDIHDLQREFSLAVEKQASIPTIKDTTIKVMGLNKEGKITSPKASEITTLTLAVARLEKLLPEIYDELLTYTKAIVLTHLAPGKDGTSIYFGTTLISDKVNYKSPAPDTINLILETLFHECLHHKFVIKYSPRDLITDPDSIKIPSTSILTRSSDKPFDYFNELNSYLGHIKLSIFLKLSCENPDIETVLRRAKYELLYVDKQLLQPLESLSNSSLTKEGRDLVTSYRSELDPLIKTACLYDSRDLESPPRS